MRHRVFGKKLGRNFNERKALLKSLTKAIFTHGYIETTEAKAKAVIPLVEKLSSLITSKEELTAKRELFKILQDQHWVNRVVTNFKSVFGDQKSNFTTTKKIKRRFGDDALIVKLSFIKVIDFKPVKKEVLSKVEEKKEGKKSKPVKKVKTLNNVKGKKESK